MWLHYGSSTETAPRSRLDLSVDKDQVGNEMSEVGVAVETGNLGSHSPILSPSLALAVGLGDTEKP